MINQKGHATFIFEEMIHHNNYGERVKEMYFSVKKEHKKQKKKKIMFHIEERKKNRCKHFYDIKKRKIQHEREMIELKELYKVHNDGNFSKNKKSLENKLECDLQSLRKDFRKKEREHSWAFLEYIRKYNSDFLETQKELFEEYRNSRSSKLHLKGNLDRARSMNLPATLSHSIRALSMLQGEVCSISGKPLTKIKYVLEHFIPLSWGMAGTTFENCYLLDRSLNSSKNNNHPIEFARKLPAEQKHNFFEKLLPMMANRNLMTVEEYVLYINKSYESRIR